MPHSEESVINSSNTTNQTECDPVSRSSLPGFMFFYILVFLVGLILNSYTLLFQLCRAQKNVSKSWMIYLKNLTAADLLLCLGLPFRIADYTDRYMKIFHPIRTSVLMTARAAHIISGTTWVFFLLFVTVYIVMMLNTKISSRSAASPCDVLQSEQAKVLNRFFHATAVIIFLLVLFFLVFCYYSASRRVSQIQQRGLGSLNSKKLVKSRQNMLVLVSVFCICFVPYHLVRLPYIILRGQCSVVLYYLKEVTLLLSVFNICLDPLIYVFLCKEFRAQLNKEFTCLASRENSITLNSKSDCAAEQ